MKNHSPTQYIGIEAEKFAFHFLKKRGLTLVQRNYVTHFGEIDLIMEDESTLIFIEVRFRSGQFVSGLETIDSHKQRKIILSASRFLQAYPTWKACRFDVITMRPDPVNLEIHWIKDAFQVE